MYTYNICFNHGFIILWIYLQKLKMIKKGNIIIITALIIFLLLGSTLTYVPIVSARQIKASPGIRTQQENNVIVTGNETIGSSSSFTTYYVFGNITIQHNSTLNVVNTALTFSSTNTLLHFITNYGTLNLVNSSIVLSNASSISQSLNLTSGSFNSTDNASLILVNSTIAAAGSIYIRNSNAKFINSTIKSQNVSTRIYKDSLTFTAYSSKLFIFNSTLSGLYHGPSQNFTAGKLSANYASNTEYLGLSKWDFEEQDVIVRNATVKMEYGGEVGSYSYLLFNESGKTIEKYDFQNTGSPSSPINVEFNFSLSPFLSSWDLHNTSIFTVYMDLATNAQANSTIFIYNITVTLNSNDTEDLLGQEYFNILLSNSTAYAVHSGFGVNYLNDYSYYSVRNPEKNAIILSDSSKLFFVGSYITENESIGSISPFEVRNSAAYICRFKEITLSSPEGYISGVSNNITSNLMANGSSSTVNDLNSEISEALSNYGIFYSNVSKEGKLELPLVVYIQNDSYSTALYYTGNYKDEVDNTTLFFSFGLFPDLTKNVSVFDAEIMVPRIIVNVTTQSIIEDSNSPINFSLCSLYASANNVTLFLNLSSGVQSFNMIQIHSVSLKQNIVTNFTECVNLSSSINPGSYNLTISAASYSEKISNGSQIASKQVEVLSNVSIKISANYAWVKPNEIVNLEISVFNNGSEGAGNSRLEATFYHNSTVLNTTSLTIEIDANSENAISLNYSSSANITSARIALLLPAVVVPFNTAGQSVTIDFKQQNAKPSKRYGVLFEENGLPRNESWSIEFGGISNSSSGNSIGFLAANGTYNFYILGVQGYRTNLYFGNVTVDGKSLIILSMWQQTLYQVRLKEINLPAGSLWGIYINNTLWHTTNSTFALELPNGTYFAKPISALSYYSVGNLSIKVDGKATSLEFPFYFDKSTRKTSINLFQIAKLPLAMSAGIAATFAYLSYWRKYTIPVCGKCGKTFQRTEKKCPYCALKEKDKNN